MSGNRLLATVALAGLLAARPPHDEEIDPPVRPAPGDSWFERLAAVAVDALPESVLPQPIRERVAAPYRARSERLAAAAWSIASTAPRGLAAAIDLSLGQRLFIAFPDVAVSAEAPAPTILLAGRPLPFPTPESIRTPGPHIWWDAEGECLWALALDAPADVRMEYLADPAGEFARFEPAFAEEEPTAAGLRRRIELARVARDALLVPAGGRVGLTVDCTRVDALRVAFAVADFARVERHGAVEPVHGASDGAVGLVEVVVDGERHRVFAAEVARADLSARWIRKVVDLRPFAGRIVRIELATAPGAAGDPWFDYGLFGDLRFEGPVRTPPDRPDVVLIDLDTLRADALSIYGNPRPTSPRLDAWARRHARVYLDVRAPAAWTLPSTVSILSGTHVHQHGVTTPSAAATRAVPLVTTLLREAGYETIGRANGGNVSTAFGFSEGFDRFESWHDDPARRMDWDATLERIRSRRSERPLFLFLHTYNTHAPFLCDRRFEDPRAPYRGPLDDLTEGVDYFDVPPEVPEGFGPPEFDRLRRFYDAAVARTDERLGEVLAELERALAGRDVLWIVTSDHGEGFGEHGNLGHGRILTEELLRIPLIVRFPRSIGRELRGVSDEPVSSLDIAPTILRAAGLPVPDHMPGRVLFEPLGEPVPRLSLNHSDRMCVELGGWKLVRTIDEERTTDRLFDVGRDPLEREDLAARMPERAAALARHLEALLERHPRIAARARGRTVQDAVTLEELRALGYGQ